MALVSTLTARAALLSHPSVDDGVIVPRVGHGATEQVAYVVRAMPVTAEDLGAHLGVCRVPVPDAFVFVARMPYLPDGEVDLAALTSVGIPDSSTALEAERRLSALPGVQSVAVVPRESPPPSLPWHLDDIVPARADLAPRHGGPASRPSDDHQVLAPASASWAVADGGALPEPGDDEPHVLGDALRRAARGRSTNGGLTYVSPDGQEQRETYAQLLERAERLLSGLQAREVQPGARVLLLLPAHADFVAAFWACVLGGLVPVPVAVPQRFDRASGLSGLQGAWRVTGPAAVITTVPAGDIERAAAEHGACPILTPAELSHAGPARHHMAQPSDLALLMMTSGSTGDPKAVMLSHRNLLARTIGSRDVNRFTDRDVSVNWMPLDHVAGLIYFHVRDVYVGMHQVHLPTSVVVQNPLAWLDALERFRATVTFAPNFAYGLVLDHEEVLATRRRDLSSVRFVLNGAEAIVARTARRFLATLAPHGLRASAMRPAWGMSETSSGVTYNARFSLESTRDDQPFVEVGRAIPSFVMRIVGAGDDLVREGDVGQLQVRGAVVTGGYFNAPELTREAFTGDGWFRTGDLGFIRDGFLTVTGRAKDVVIVNSVNYYCHAIESVVEAADDVVPSHTAACAIRRPGADTDSLAIFFVPRYEDPATVAGTLRRVRADVTSTVGLNPEVVVPLPPSEIPKTSVGKIQRSSLAQRFVTGGLEEHRRHAERLLGGEGTVPRWFFRPVWQPKNGAGAMDLTGEHVVVFGDGPLAVEVRWVLAARGAHTIGVEAGGEWHRPAAGAYVIDPANPAHYKMLLTDLSALGIASRHVIHLWESVPCAGIRSNEDLEAAQTRGSLSIIALVQALELVHTPGETTRLTSVASHVHRIRAGDTVAPERATTLGVIRSQAQESDWLWVRHVDLDGDDVTSAADLVVREHAEYAADREVAYRDRRRLVPRFEAVTFAEPMRSPALKRGGCYLVTGGVGGVGLVVAAWLVERFQANLLLVGRRSLEGGPADAIGRLSRQGDVAYEAVDVSDAERLAAVVAAHEARWGHRLDGVLHLAGSSREGLIADESREGFLDVLRPKMIGTHVLHALLAARGGGLFVAWSSVAGVFGGANLGAYAAACAFQRAYAVSLSGADGVEHVCLDWSGWDETGGSARYPAESRRARGYVSMPPAMALESLVVALAAGERSMVIGLDSHHRHARRLLVGEVDAVGHLAAFYTSAAAVTDTQAAAEVTDRFGCRVSAVVTRLPRLPTLDTGELDVNRLSTWGREDTSARSGGAPATEGERRLAPLWRRVLSTASVLVTDNFFDCGGDSLSAVRLAGLVRQELDVELPVRAVFEAVTFADLARAIAGAPRVVQEAHATAPRPGTSDAADLLARVDDLSDEQVEALLAELGNEQVSGT